MNSFAAIPGVAWLLSVFVWSYVYAQRRDAPVNRSFLVFSACASLWILIKLLLYVPAARGHEELLFRAAGLFWIPLGFLGLDFAYRLAGRERDRLWKALLVITAGLVVVYTFTDLAYRGYSRESWGVAAIASPMVTAIAFYSAVLATFGLFLIFGASRRTSDSTLSTTLRILCLGGAITMGSILLNNVVLPYLLGLTQVFRFGASSMSIFCIFCYWAVARHQFLTLSAEAAAEQFFDDVGDGILLTDPAGRVRRLNRAFAEMLGVEAEQWHGRDVDQLVPELLAGADYADRDVLYGGRGEEQVFSASQSTYSRGRTELGKVFLLTDITERKRAGRLLERSRDELEEVVERRTNELRQAQKLEALGTLAGGIAHDFNNLLAAILGFAGAARSDLPERSPIREDLDEVLFAAHRAKNIVQQILTFSRRKDEVKERMDVAEAARETVALLESSLPSTIRIVGKFDRMAGLVDGDPEQVNQVLMNLATNAFQAMESRGGELTIKVEPAQVDVALADRHPPLEPGPHVRIEVSDTGEGIDEGHLSRIFDPFFTTKPAGEGTGLGLSTVLTIVRNHDGAITVDSSRERGTTFRVFLPVVVDA